jgi:hypothetical protein
MVSMVLEAGHPSEPIMSLYRFGSLPPSLFHGKTIHKKYNHSIPSIVFGRDLNDEE